MKAVRDLVTVLAIVAGAALAAAQEPTDFPEPGFSAPDSTLVLPALREHETPDTLLIERVGHPLSIVAVQNTAPTGTENTAALLAGVPGARVESSGWQGHRSSIACGALPPPLTTVILGGRDTYDPLFGGLDLLEAYGTSSGTVLVPSGPDISIWPFTTAERVHAAPIGPAGLGAGGGAGLAVSVHPGRKPAATPFARAGMMSGDLGARGLSFEFGRRLLDGDVGLQGFMETSEGRAPVPGGSYDSGTMGGVITIPLAGAWRVDARGMRVDVERHLPFDSSYIASVANRLIRSDIDLVATDGATRVQLFHTENWLDSDRLGSGDGGIEGATDGVALTFAVGPFDAVRIHGASHRARGTLLRESERAATVAAGVDRRLTYGSAWTLYASLGADYEREAFIPQALLLLTHGPRASGFWLAANLGGRRPTVVELALVETPIPDSGGGSMSVEGNPALDSETAATLSCGWSTRGRIVSGGLAGGLSRLDSGIVLLEGDGGVLSPVNRSSEIVGALSLWAVVDDSLTGGARMRVDLTEDGDPQGLVPAPPVLIDAEVWLVRLLFKETLRARLAIGAIYEAPDVADDYALRTRAGLTADVGPAHIYVHMDDPFETDRPRWPGRDPAGRLLTVGFSWDFWN